MNAMATHPSPADHFKRRPHEARDQNSHGSDGGRSGQPPGSKYDDPPNSRLFIVCGKSITEDEVKEAFEVYGGIEEIWVLKDKVTNEPKGVTYIKFSNTKSRNTQRNMKKRKMFF